MVVVIVVGGDGAFVDVALFATVSVAAFVVVAAILAAAVVIAVAVAAAAFCDLRCNGRSQSVR